MQLYLNGILPGMGKINLPIPFMVNNSGCGTNKAASLFELKYLSGRDDSCHSPPVQEPSTL
jgi:hypothetical protein